MEGVTYPPLLGCFKRSPVQLLFGRGPPGRWFKRPSWCFLCWRLPAAAGRIKRSHRVRTQARAFQSTVVLADWGPTLFYSILVIKSQDALSVGIVHYCCDCTRRPRSHPRTGRRRSTWNPSARAESVVGGRGRGHQPPVGNCSVCQWSLVVVQ